MLRVFNYRRPVNLVLIVNLIGFGLLCYHNSSKAFDWKTLLAGLIISILICITYLIIVKKSMGDEYLFLIVGMLASIGFIMIFRLDADTGFKQFTWLLAGIILFMMTYVIFRRLRIWNNIIYFYIITPFVLYIMTLAIGKNVAGAKNWIAVPGFRFQPSELIKILFVLFLACYYKDSDKEITHYKLPFVKFEIPKRILLILVVYGNIGFLFLQKEWGTALLFLLVFLVCLFIFDNNKKFLIYNSIAFVVCAVIGYLLFYHIRVRVDIWIDPWSTINGKGYQIAQSLFAIAAGGFFGTGIGVGSPDLIPAVNTDFIFSAICEEMGIFGGMAVILLFFILTYRGFKITINMRNKFNKVLALGITTLFGLQTFIIIGGVIKLIPLTGITLPFVSYGGSSIIASFIMLGLLQAVSSPMSEPKEVAKYEGA